MDPNASINTAAGRSGLSTHVWRQSDRIVQTQMNRTDTTLAAASTASTGTSTGHNSNTLSSASNVSSHTTHPEHASSSSWVDQAVVHGHGQGQGQGSSPGFDDLMRQLSEHIEPGKRFWHGEDPLQIPQSTSHTSTLDWRASSPTYELVDFLNQYFDSPLSPPKPRHHASSPPKHSTLSNSYTSAQKSNTYDTFSNATQIALSDSYRRPLSESLSDAKPRSSDIPRPLRYSASPKSPETLSMRKTRARQQNCSRQTSMDISPSSLSKPLPELPSAEHPPARVSFDTSPLRPCRTSTTPPRRASPNTSPEQKAITRKRAPSFPHRILAFPKPAHEPLPTQTQTAFPRVKSGTISSPVPSPSVMCFDIPQESLFTKPRVCPLPTPAPSAPSSPPTHATHPANEPEELYLESSAFDFDSDDEGSGFSWGLNMGRKNKKDKAARARKKSVSAEKEEKKEKEKEKQRVISPHHKKLESLLKSSHKEAPSQPRSSLDSDTTVRARIEPSGKQTGVAIPGSVSCANALHHPPPSRPIIISNKSEPHVVTQRSVTAPNPYVPSSLAQSQTHPQPHPGSSRSVSPTEQYKKHHARRSNLSTCSAAPSASTQDQDIDTDRTVPISATTSSTSTSTADTSASMHSSTAMDRSASANESGSGTQGSSAVTILSPTSTITTSPGAAKGIRRKGQTATSIITPPTSSETDEDSRGDVLAQLERETGYGMTSPTSNAANGPWHKRMFGVFRNTNSGEKDKTHSGYTSPTASMSSNPNSNFMGPAPMTIIPPPHAAVSDFLHHTPISLADAIDVPAPTVNLRSSALPAPMIARDERCAIRSMSTSAASGPTTAERGDRAFMKGNEAVDWREREREARERIWRDRERTRVVGSAREMGRRGSE